MGCKVNQYETQCLTELFINNGFSLSQNAEEADVCIINSCTVTAESDRKTRQAVRRFRAKNPDAAIVLTGCMPQAFPEESAILKEVDIVMGNTDLEKIYNAVIVFLSNKVRYIDISKHIEGEIFNTPSITAFNEHTRAFMKIQDGCDRFCTYCIIPTSRGRIRSKKIEEIKRETLSLSKAGFKEVVLVGINLSSFGRGEDCDICDAVDAVSAVEGILRVRLGSIEPDLITDKMLNRLAENDKFCPQFHLSLQSGSDTILKIMNRHYDTAFFADLVSRIRKNFNNSSITTDIMVGFAGEDEKEFQNSLEFVKQIGFARAHIFAYSRRKGTVAYNMQNQVSNKEKALRAKRMAALTDQTEQEFLQSQVGKTVNVLFETAEGNKYFGYSENYTGVFALSDDDLGGQIKKVKIIENDKNYCNGEVVIGD